MNDTLLFEEIYFKELELEKNFAEEKLNEIVNLYQVIILFNIF